MQLMDSMLENSWSMDEAWRCLHVALLCVQENPEERPTMSSVVLMLRSEQMVLSRPMTPPTYGGERISLGLASSSSTSISAKLHSVNEVTLTHIEPR